MARLQQAGWDELLSVLVEDVAQHESLAEAPHDRDDEAWNEMARRLTTIAAAIARRTGGTVNPDEIVQDVLVKLQASRVLNKVSQARQPLEYLFSLLRNTATDKLREANRAVWRLRPLSDAIELQSVSDIHLLPGENEAVVSPRRVARLREEIDRLRPQDQLLLKRRFVENRPTSEIATELGVSYAAIAQRLHRLLGSLRESLADE